MREQSALDTAMTDEMAQCQELDGAGNPVPESLCQFP
jgi:hypothetical protein